VSQGSASAQFSLPTAQMLIRVFDANKSGQIDFQEFVQLHQFVAVMQGAFYRHDADRSNRLDAREVGLALSESGFQFSQPVISSLIKKYTQGNWNSAKQELTFENYIQLSAFLGTLKSTFEVQDTDHDGIISMGFDQLASIAAGV